MMSTHTKCKLNRVDILDAVRMNLRGDRRRMGVKRARSHTQARLYLFFVAYYLLFGGATQATVTPLVVAE
jgi:hypothetical protein